VELSASVVELATQLRANHQLRMSDDDHRCCSLQRVRALQVCLTAGA
jgi:hypothetical protein